MMALMREALRTLVRIRAADPAHREVLRPLVWRCAPRLPARLRTAAQVARFKRAQREFDRVVLDLQLAAPAEIEARNSIAPLDQPVRLIDFDRAHAATGTMQSSRLL